MSTPVLALPTVGSATFDVTGTALGLSTAVVTVTYAGGSDGLARRSHTLPPGACTVVSPGAALRCPSLPGVGANYTFTVAVDGGVSDASATTLSYAPPVINSLSGEGAAGADTAGGAVIVLHGANFGPVNGTAVAAWASPVSDVRLVFPGRDCAVIEPQVAIRCTVTAGMGAAVSWRVVVEGQANSMPLASYAAPVLHAVEFAEAGVTVADTQGGTLVSLRGRNFGNDVGYVAVTVTTVAGATPVPGCTLAANHTELLCPLPAGAGVVSLVTVSVLGQLSAFPPAGLAYAPPVITGVGPAVWSTDLSGMLVTVVGRGFGSPSLAHVVRVAIAGVTCGGLLPVNLTIQDVAVRNDTQLLLTFGGVPSHVVPWWAVSVTVAGQDMVAGAVHVATRAPAVADLALSRPYNGTHYFLLVRGRDFGPPAGQGGCPGDAVVTIDGEPCDSLSIVVVRAARARCTMNRGCRASAGCGAMPFACKRTSPSSNTCLCARGRFIAAPHPASVRDHAGARVRAGNHWCGKQWGAAVQQCGAVAAAHCGLGDPSTVGHVRTDCHCH